MSNTAKTWPFRTLVAGLVLVIVVGGVNMYVCSVLGCDKVSLETAERVAEIMSSAGYVSAETSSAFRMLARDALLKFMYLSAPSMTSVWVYFKKGVEAGEQEQEITEGEDT